MHKDNKVAHEVHVDACLSGMGVCGMTMVYATPIIDFYGFQATIVGFEMLNIFIAFESGQIMESLNGNKYTATTVLLFILSTQTRQKTLYKGCSLAIVGLYV